MNYTTRRKRSNKKSLKTRKHRGGINWKFWEKTAPANAPPAPAEVVENKCPPCPVCAQAQQAQAQQAQAQQAQAMQEPAMQEPAMQEPAMQAPAMQAPGSMMMSGGRRRRGRKSSRKNRKSKKWFQMGCKSMF